MKNIIYAFLYVKKGQDMQMFLVIFTKFEWLCIYYLYFLCVNKIFK